MNYFVDAASEIRTNTGAKLLRKISLRSMHNSLIDLFQDRTSMDNVNLFDEDGIRKVLRYSKCQDLNDASTIEFNQSSKQDDYVFDESKQIWIPSRVNPITDDLFIPRDDAQ